MNLTYRFFFFFSSRRRHTRSLRDWSSDVCSSDLGARLVGGGGGGDAAPVPCTGDEEEAGREARRDEAGREEGGTTGARRRQAPVERSQGARALGAAGEGGRTRAARALAVPSARRPPFEDRGDGRRAGSAHQVGNPM